MMQTRRFLGVAAAATIVTGLLLPMEAAFGATCVVTEDATTNTSSIAGDCTLDSTYQVPNGWTFDGNGHTITAAGTVSGAVIESEHGTAGNPPKSMTVGHVTIDATGAGAGADGILFYGAEGSVKDSTIQGGQNGVEADNSVGAMFGTITDQVKVGGTTITGYQHAGVYAHGDLKLNVLLAVIGSPEPASGSVAGVWMEQGAHGSIKENHIRLSDAEPAPASFGAGVRIEKDASALPRRVEVKRNVFTGGDADFGISVSNVGQLAKMTADINCNLIRRHDTSTDDPFGVGVAQWQDSSKTNVLVSNSTFKGWNHATGTVSGTNVTAGPDNTLGRSTSTCPPGPPTHVHAARGDHRIKVTWHAAVAPDYAPLTGYRVKAKAAGHRAITKKVGPKATSAVLKGLKNNRTYVVTVTARSNGGHASGTDRVQLRSSR